MELEYRESQPGGIRIYLHLARYTTTSHTSAYKTGSGGVETRHEHDNGSNLHSMQI